MRIHFFRSLFIPVLLLILSSCAQRGRPDGGPKDTEPPEFLNSSPENYSTNYDEEEIVINFDEYLVLKEPQQQILFSPPIEPRPSIYPLGPASRYIRLDIPKDSLEENTTYTVNFGTSIQDNNEGIVLPYFKYVFSTGGYVDSLQVEGNVFDAYNRLSDENISVMLYALDSTYSDSVVYNQSPRYITYVRDSTSLFSLDNLKAGNYKMVAISDKNNNYKFDPAQDKIGFVEDTVKIPTNQLYDILVFKEVLDFEASRPSQISRQHLEFGFQGRLEDYKIDLISETTEAFESRYFRDEDKDTLHYWFKPYLEKDSLLFTFSNQGKIDTLEIRPKQIEKDSLIISEVKNDRNKLLTDFKLKANTPISSFQKDSIQLFRQDSIPVDFKLKMDTIYNHLVFEFEKQGKTAYQINLLPGAVTDFFEAQNDSLSFRYNTRPLADFGNLALTINNIDEYPVIVELIDERGKVESSVYETEKSTVFFKLVKPANYYIRLIYDLNANGRWDTGDFLKGIKPEPVLYENEPVKIRANWDDVLSINLY
ncbi:Ig-like domain-containing protein [Psychroflexus sp. YR1-1]|uniref:Ig-like domain-containing protein n=1 Tax=Psychroflexus aurantiacus TaxID=2709310 RepID=A0A6B3QXR8_9FLAO|nr:Ig-like domain-containing protein [Psychroflexus aurantiacus]NEV93003.1 Ig-like domain-containing protein [Psychroflexus aurantiacus]